MIRVILNPYANRGRGYLRARQRLIDALTKAQLSYTLVETTTKGEATEIAREAAMGGVEVVVAAGGDGTIHEVVNGLMALDDGQALPKLAIFPVGTANDLALALSISRRMGQLTDAIAQRQTRQIDVGSIAYRTGAATKSRYFINNVGIGLEAFVVQKANKIRHLRGSLLYLVAALQSLWAYDATEMSLQWGGTEGLLQEPASQKQSGKVLMLTVGNGRRAGGGFYLTPDACLDDGLLDAGILRDVSKSQLVQLLLKARSGKHVHDPAITMLRTQKLQIRAEKGVPIHADGEILALSAQEIELGIATRKLEVVVP